MKKIIFSEIVEPDKMIDKKEIFSYIEEFIKTHSEKYSWKAAENKCECNITPRDIFFQPSPVDYYGEIDTQTLKSKHKIIIMMDSKLNKWFWIDLVIIVISTAILPELTIFIIGFFIYSLNKHSTFRYYFFSGLKRFLNEKFEGWE